MEKKQLYLVFKAAKFKTVLPISWISQNNQTYKVWPLLKITIREFSATFLNFWAKWGELKANFIYMGKNILSCQGKIMVQHEPYTLYTHHWGRLISVYLIGQYFWNPSLTRITLFFDPRAWRASFWKSCKGKGRGFSSRTLLIIVATSSFRRWLYLDSVIGFSSSSIISPASS